MNRSYRSIWNDTSGTFVAVSENANSAGKKSSPGATAMAGGARFALKALAISLMLSFGANLYALPTGGVVSAGSASISSAAGSTTITQSTQNAAINWQSFNIGATEAVRFVQPNSSSVVLNRVLGSDPSSILGSLSANGKVFLVNPNGILFGQGASVNVGGLLASTLNIADSDFMAGSYKFSGSSGAEILNRGAINASGGYVALLGAKVSNEGVISARLGTVALAAGNAITLDVAGDGLLNVTVNQGVVNALVQNGGLIQADGGQVLLTAQSASGLLQSAVNNTGVIRAQTLVTGKDGSIKLMGDMQSGTVNVGGTLDASAPNGGNGGFIETSAAYVKIASGVQITTAAPMGQTGTWLIDPVDFNVGSAPGDNITGADLSAQLGGTDIVIATVAGPGLENGDINVNEAVTWSAPTTLTLNAFNDVNFNAAVTASNGGSLVANAGHDVVVAANIVTGITTTGGNITWTAGRDIQVNSNLPGQTGVTATFAAGDTGNITWRAGRDVNINSQVTATGSAAGILDGNFTVCCGRDIKVNAATTTTDGDTILKAGRDIVVNAAMTTTRGNVILRAGSEPSAAVPGLIGGTVVFTTATPYTVNGPVPLEVTVDYTPTSYATPTDYSTNFTGDGAVRLQSHMLVFAQGNNKVYDGNTNATLTFRGDPTLGGVVTLVPGTAFFDTKDVGTGKPITYTGYSLGGADAAKFALWGTCTAVYGSGITNANITPRPVTVKADDATKVYGQTFTPLTTAFTVPVPPLPGETITSVTETTSGTPPTVPVASYPITPSNATGANFNPANYTITYLNGALTVTPAPLVLTANDATKVYGTTFTPAGTAFTQVGLVNSDTVTSVAETSTGSPPTASVADSPYPIIITPGSAAGSFTPTNYTISYVDGRLIVTPAPLTITANNATKVYGQTFTPASTAFTTTALQNGETVGSVTETSPTGTPPTAAVPGPYAIIPTSATGGTFTPSNYTITYVNGALTVTPKALIGSITAANKPYDATTAATILTRTLAGPLAGDVVSYSGGSATFDTPNPGTGKTVTGTGLGLSGADRGNYTVNPTAITTADIAPMVVAPPFAPPVVAPPVMPVNWIPAGVRTPPELLTLAPTVVPAAVPVVAPPVVRQPAPVVVPVETPPEIYVAPVRPRKQDRN